MHRIKIMATLWLLSFGFAAAWAQAGTITVQDSIDDYEAQKRSDATGGYVASESLATGSRVGHQTNFNGSGSNLPGGITSVFFFQLPNLLSYEAITGATFSVGRLADTASTAITPTFNGDLYALGVVNSIPKSVADAQKFFYLGNTAQASLPVVAGSSTVGGVVSRVADNFLVPAEFIPSTGTSAASPDTADVTSYIQNLYDDPSGNGFTPGTSYLVIRVNPDLLPAPTSGTQRYTLAFQGTGPSGNGGAGTAANRPLITLQVIPEPASVVLLCLAVLGALGMRRTR